MSHLHEAWLQRIGSGWADDPETQRRMEEIADILLAPSGRSTSIYGDESGHEGYGGVITQRSDGKLYLDGQPLRTLYRVVDPGEWADAQANGFLQSDAASGSGYTRASAAPDERWRYHTRSGERALTLEIDYDPADGWHASAEGYAATHARIPLSRVRKVGVHTSVHTLGTAVPWAHGSGGPAGDVRGRDGAGDHRGAPGRARGGVGPGLRGRVAEAVVYSIWITRSAKQDHRALPPDQRNLVTRACKALRRDPSSVRAHPLKGKLSGFYGLEVTTAGKGRGLRVLYGIEGTRITVYGCGTHEGFYERMKRRLASVSGVKTGPVTLDYPYGGTPLRFYIEDTDFAGDPKSSYHQEPGVVSFLDTFDQGDRLFIAYMHTHRDRETDYGGRGHARKLVQAVYDRFYDFKSLIDWGDIMDDKAFTLFQSFKERYPNSRGRYR